MSSTAVRLSRALAASLLLVALGPASTAGAAPPTVTITSPTGEEEFSSETVSIRGTAEEGPPVAVRIYRRKAEGAPAQELGATPTAGTWSVSTAPLTNGTYIAVAEQVNGAAEPGTSAAVTFYVDTPPPVVTLNAPESPSSNTTPSFTGTASGTKQVWVDIYAGGKQSGKVVSKATAAVSDGSWTSGYASPPLSTGQYTAVASEASSLSGNPDGTSPPVTFTIAPPPGPLVTQALGPGASLPSLAPPLVSFRWFPSVPQTGETVSIVSTASDTTSAITGLAWALTGSGPFQPGGSVLTTSFSTPGSHVVRLRVTNAYGLSSIAAETINVVGPKVSLMQPYPVVRLAGSETRSGVRLRLLEVQQLPIGARITVRCKSPPAPRHRGRTPGRCPTTRAVRIAAANRIGNTAVAFRTFERTLRFGVTLEILVSAPGEIGKYTRFTVRRGRLPLRVDMCLDPTGVKPIACPSS
jgi:hypothetical protein